MTEINLQKRAVYAGDVHIALLKSGWSIREACDFVNGLPTADVAEVRHGHWEWLGPNELTRGCMCGTCSACKIRSKYIVNTGICPNCGAQMDGGADHVSHSQDDYDAFISGTQPQREDV